jgi:hypothetical protein
MGQCVDTKRFFDPMLEFTLGKKPASMLQGILVLHNWGDTGAYSGFWSQSKEATLRHSSGFWKDQRLHRLRQPGLDCRVSNSTHDQLSQTWTYCRHSSPLPS